MEMSTMQPFRVDNKHSIFLNERNNLHPIYLRTPEIIRNKEHSVEKMRIELNMER
jgi:hypothetical protein